MIFDLHHLAWPETGTEPEVLGPYQPKRHEVLTVIKPYVAKSLWRVVDKIVGENSSIGDILQQIDDEQLVAEYSRRSFEEHLKKLYRVYELKSHKQKGF